MDSESQLRLLNGIIDDFTSYSQITTVYNLENGASMLQRELAKLKSKLEHINHLLQHTKGIQYDKQPEIMELFFTLLVDMPRIVQNLKKFTDTHYLEKNISDSLKDISTLGTKLFDIVSPSMLSSDFGKQIANDLERLVSDTTRNHPHAMQIFSILLQIYLESIETKNESAVYGFLKIFDYLKGKNYKGEDFYKFFTECTKQNTIDKKSVQSFILSLMTILVEDSIQKESKNGALELCKLVALEKEFKWSDIEWLKTWHSRIKTIISTNCTHSLLENAFWIKSSTFIIFALLSPEKGVLELFHGDKNLQKIFESVLLMKPLQAAQLAQSIMDKYKDIAVIEKSVSQ